MSGLSYHIVSFLSLRSVGQGLGKIEDGEMDLKVKVAIACVCWIEMGSIISLIRAH